MNPPLTMIEAQRAAIVEALRYTRGDIPGASYFLGIGRTTIYRKLREFEIRPDEYQTDWSKAAGESS
jgi:transcriptional regulator of acetoin/glycerol metabolism